MRDVSRVRSASTKGVCKYTTSHWSTSSFSVELVWLRNDVKTDEEDCPSDGPIIAMACAVVVRIAIESAWVLDGLLCMQIIA
jgi:hypothetical protein